MSVSTPSGNAGGSAGILRASERKATIDSVMLMPAALYGPAALSAIRGLMICSNPCSRATARMSSSKSQGPSRHTTRP